MGNVVAVMVVAGIFGAAVSVVMGDAPTWAKWRLNAIAGIGAALLVPLFLRTVSSGLLGNLLGSTPAPEDWLVFAGFCLLAGVTARRFIETLSERVLQEVREARSLASAARQEASDVRSATIALADRTSQIASGTNAALDAVNYGTRPAPAPGPPAALFPPVTPGPTPDDPWARAFGGQSEAHGRRLEAEITPVPDRAGSMTVTLRVVATEGAPPLAGAVQFYLHSSFANDRPVVPVRNGEAAITVLAWGAFTAGALADQGQTKLELNLAEHPHATEPWRSR